MFELAVAILILISIFVFLKIRKKKLSVSGEQEKPVAQKSIPANDAPSSSQKEKSKVENLVASAKPAPTQAQEPVTTDFGYKNKNIPQDSMLRRHYLAYIQAMITELNQPCPTDFTLNRHHQSLLASKLELYLNDEVATEKLTQCYENYKKSSVPVVQKPQATAPALSESKAACMDNAEQKADCKGKASKIPEDSMLKRHYLGMLSAQVAGKLPPRPTDSTLRRHYDAMLETEIKKQLDC